MIDIATFSVVIKNQTKNVAPANGFIDFKNANHYITLDPSGIAKNLPTSLELAEAKARGFYRFKQIINICGFSVNILEMTNMVATGANVNTEASQVSFTITYDKPSYLNTNDELNPGELLSGADCVKRWIAKALSNTYHANEEVYDPTPSLSNTNVLRGPVIEDLVIGPINSDIKTLESAITVTLVGVDTARVNDAIKDQIEY